VTRLGFDSGRLALALALLLPASALGWSGGVTPPGGGGDAAAITYTPDDGANWSDPDPADVAAALDALAATAAGVITAALQDIDDLGVVGAADKYIYSTGAGVWAYGTVTAAGRALLDDANAVAQLATLGLPTEYRVCSTCAYTTIQAAMNAAGTAGGGVVRVAPGTYSETVTAAAGVSMVCGAGGVAGSATKRCRINGTAGNPALVIDVGVPGGARENHVFSADGFLLLGGAGVGVGAVSFECPVAAAQRAELSNVSMVTGASGNALRVTCGAVGSGGLLSSLRLHGDYVEVWSQGSTEATVYHSAGYFDWRGRAVISATSGDDVAFEIPAAATGAVTVWWFEIIGRLTVAATSTATLTLGQGIITTATSAPIATNGSGATTLGVVGLYAAGAAPAGGCVQGAGLLVHTPSALQNIGNCGTLIAGTVNGGAGPDVAALQSRFESTIAPATYQPISAALQDIDDLGVVAAADKFIYSTGAGVWAYGDITTAGRALLDDASAGDQRTTLGLGALATGASAADVPFVCSVDANWTGGLCPGNSGASLDDLASRVVTLESATVDAADVTFTPTTLGDWTGDADPGDVDEALDDLASRVETLEGAGGGGGGGGGGSDSVIKSISQAAHGLAVGDWVRLSGTSYVKAQADSAANAEVVGVVNSVAGAANFTLTVAGRVTGLSGLTAGTVYYLDPSTAGAITATEPSGANVSKPVLIADSTTAGWVLQMRGTISAATAGWDWAQAVASPAAADWADASASGADVSMTAISDGTVGDYVILNPGTGTTDQYGVTMAAAAGDWVWCARISRLTTDGSGAVTTATAGMDFVLVAAFVDGTDLDNSTWNGAGLIGGAQDWNGSDIGSVSGPGSGSDRWDGALVAGEVQDFMGWSTADVCLERSGTDLIAWIGQRAGGFQKADSWTVSADAGLYAIVLRDTDAGQHHRVRLDAYGLLSAVPGLE
jgi:hypothetical protein